MKKPDSKRHHRVYPSYWTKNPHWTDDAKLLGLFLLTGSHRRTEGLYRLPVPYMAADLGWPEKRARKALDELIAEGFVAFDERAGVVLILKALKHQGLDNPNQIKAALDAISELPRTDLLTGLLQAAERFCELFAERLRERFPERLGQPLRQPLFERLGEPSGEPHSSSSSSSSSSKVSLTTDRAGANADTLLVEMVSRLNQVPSWQRELMQGADMAVRTMLDGNPGVPWLDLADEAVSSRLDTSPGSLRTDSPVKALQLRLEDHRFGRRGRGTGSTKQAAESDADRQWRERRDALIAGDAA
jgi:hypothetical protein